MGNYPTMSEASIKSYLIRGAARNPSLTYPNKEFGYGTLDLLQTFLRLRSDRIPYPIHFILLLPGSGDLPFSPDKAL